MIQKYYSGVIEQEFRKIGVQSRNIVFVKYNNEFSLKDLKFPGVVRNQEGIYLAVHEFNYQEVLNPFEPFLDLICELYRKYGAGDFGAFLDAQEIYYLHKEIFMSYYETGVCTRKEDLILPEVSFESDRMMEEMVALLTAVSGIHPFMLVLNRMQIAPAGTVALVTRLLHAAGTRNFALILSMNDASPIPAYMKENWEKMMETLEDASKIIHIGRAGTLTGETEHKHLFSSRKRIREAVVKINNLIHMLDFGQANYYLQILNRRIKLENMEVEDNYRFEVFELYATVCIYTSFER